MSESGSLDVSPALVTGVGGTESERYPQLLCTRSFLSLWSHAHVFRDQGRAGGKGDGRELCDLLVVFGNHIILFSDKFCGFPDSGTPVIDWQRWYKKAVRKSADQLWGAESHIRAHPDTLYLDPACPQPFPFPLPEPARARVHRIAVAHGAAERCRAHFGGGSGSLMLNTEVAGDAELFTIGQIDPAKGFVHVLDDTTLDIVLDTVDTISDFVGYLDRKERFLTSGRKIFVAGEEEFLAYYLRYTNSQGEHDFVVPDGSAYLVDTYDGIWMEEGLWDEFYAHPQRVAQLEANAISYSWDALIETFAGHARAGTQYYTTQPGVEHTEIILRFLAAEPRTRRRMLARALHEVIAAVPPTGFAKYSRVMLPSRPSDPYYVFLAVSQPTTRSEEEYREFRRLLLEAHCRVTKLVYPDVEDIVGLATEAGMDPAASRSEDAIYLDAREWDDALNADAADLQRQLGILTHQTQHRGTEKEYPDVDI